MAFVGKKAVNALFHAYQGKITLNFYYHKWSNYQRGNSRTLKDKNFLN